MLNLTRKAEINPTFQAMILAFNGVVLTVAAVGTVVLLIGAYHTVIFLVAYSWAPVFLFTVPVVTLSLAVGVIFLKQPVHNLLCLITVFFTTTLLYLYAGAEFLAFLFLIVYVGAIAILFLFVIMLLHLKEVTAAPRPLTSLTVATLGLSAGSVIIGTEDLVATEVSVFFTTGDLILFKTASASTDLLIWFVNNQHTDILTFSHLLYTYHSFLFYLSGLLLLTAMLGAIILAANATDLSSDNHSLTTGRKGMLLMAFMPLPGAGDIGVVIVLLVLGALFHKFGHPPVYTEDNAPVSVVIEKLKYYCVTNGLGVRPEDYERFLEKFYSGAWTKWSELTKLGLSYLPQLLLAGMLAFYFLHLCTNTTAATIANSAFLLVSVLPEADVLGVPALLAGSIIAFLRSSQKYPPYNWNYVPPYFDAEHRQIMAKHVEVARDGNHWGFPRGIYDSLIWDIKYGSLDSVTRIQDRLDVLNLAKCDVDNAITALTGAHQVPYKGGVQESLAQTFQENEARLRGSLNYLTHVEIPESLSIWNFVRFWWKHPISFSVTPLGCLIGFSILIMVLVLYCRWRGSIRVATPTASATASKWVLLLIPIPDGETVGVTVLLAVVAAVTLLINYWPPAPAVSALPDIKLINRIIKKIERAQAKDSWGFPSEVYESFLMKAKAHTFTTRESFLVELRAIRLARRDYEGAVKAITDAHWAPSQEGVEKIVRVTFSEDELRLSYVLNYLSASPLPKNVDIWAHVVSWMTHDMVVTVTLGGCLAKLFILSIIVWFCYILGAAVRAHP